MRKFLVLIIFSGIVLYSVYYFRDPLFEKALPLINKIAIIFRQAPCTVPIPYDLGTFDEKFNITQEYFLSALLEAESVWEESIDKDLFSYRPFKEDADVLKINLIYDYRQEATSKLASLGVVVNNTKASYESLKNKFNTLKTQHEINLMAFNKSVESFNQEKKIFEDTVNFWNKKGGAPQDVYNKIQQDKINLENKFQQLKNTQLHISANADEINALVVVLNRLIVSLNLSVEKYNAVTEERGETFQEGVFSTDGNIREIDIYEFSSRDKLVRVLIHELGHALGLEHIDDPRAIMYQFNEGDTKSLAESDVLALRTQCGLN